MASPQPHSIVAPYNYHGHSMLAHYNLSVSPQDQSIQNINENPQRPNKLVITPTDWFKFRIEAYALSCSFDLISTTFFVNLKTLVDQSCQEIPCKAFFQEGQDFLRSHLSHPNIPSESLDMIMPRIMDRVQQLFEDSLHSVPSDSEYRVFPLDLKIVVEYEPEPVDISAVMEESLQHFRMIPASKNAINSLKKFKVMKQNEYCTICKEEFDVSRDDDDVAASAMPCDHVFHQQCIVQWLQTSHVCPLCRYPMPTANEDSPN